MVDKNDKCTPPGRYGAKSSKRNISTNKNNRLKGKTDQESRPKHRIINAAQPTPRRKRTLQEAKRLVDGSSLPINKRRYAYRSLRRAKQPVREAKRIVQRYEADKHKLNKEPLRAVDLSDVQELRVTLIQRDLGIWPPHTDYLRRMELDILTIGMTWDEFERRSVEAMKMEQALEKAFRKAEKTLALTGKWTEK